MQNRLEQKPVNMNALKKCQILIIEDNSYVREAFELTLLKTGLNATVLTTAEEAMEAVKKHSFDIIISDYSLPGMDGLEFFTLIKMKTLESTKVLISAYGFDGITSKAEAVGVDYFFVKPFSIHKLLMRLNLNRSKTEENSVF